MCFFNRGIISHYFTLMNMSQQIIAEWMKPQLASDFNPSLNNFLLPAPLPVCVSVYVIIATDLGKKEVTTESSGEFLTPSRHGPGSCLRDLVDFLTETHNSVVREARKVSRQEDRSVNLMRPLCPLFFLLFLLLFYLLLRSFCLIPLVKIWEHLIILYP